MNQTSLEKVNALRKNLLECPICLQEFDETDRKPRLLPCLHAVCDECLKSLSRNNKLTCPECRTEHQVERSFANIPFDRTRRYLADFVKVKLNLEIICENCDHQHTATHRCRECAMFLCKDCLVTHQSMRTLRNKHTVFSLQLGPNEEHNVSDFANQQYCEEHEDQRLSLYCSGSNCKTPICQTCYVIGHRRGTGHDVKDIGKVYEAKKYKLMDLARSVEGRAKIAQKTALDVKEAKRDLKGDTQKAINDVKRSFEICRRSLERRKNNHIKTIKAISDQKLKVFEEQEQKLISYIDCTKSDSDFLRQTLSAKNKAGLLTIEPSITRKFQSLRDQPIDKQPVQIAQIEFAKGNMMSDFDNTVQTLGNVLSSSLYAPNTVMIVPTAPRKNENYSIKVRLFDYDKNLITLANTSVEVVIKPRDGFAIRAVCVKTDNGGYSTSWRPKMAGFHMITCYANIRKTKLTSKDVIVGPERAEETTVFNALQRDTLDARSRPLSTGDSRFPRLQNSDEMGPKPEEKKTVLKAFQREAPDLTPRPLLPNRRTCRYGNKLRHSDGSG